MCGVVAGSAGERNKRERRVTVVVRCGGVDVNWKERSTVQVVVVSFDRIEMNNDYYCLFFNHLFTQQKRIYYTNTRTRYNTNNTGSVLNSGTVPQYLSAHY